MDPIIQGNFVIQKMEMKGGWSYVILPVILPKSGLPFGWKVVRGTIDFYEISQFKLWPTQDNQLFLPVKAEIRKKISKQAGDTVRVVLYEDNSEVIIPDEFLLCLMEHPLAEYHFKKMTPTNQKQYVDFVSAVKSQDAKTRRMVVVLEKLEKGLKFHEKGYKE